ncbi:phosphate/phosphite/phosphonate ABC transporter substrate-binding protein [Saccharothrix violaceirubra]|uniref:Phosphonate transport system substrate-binding protein n=1 Tax=Saccharothrix violaceirubra TaxID=413306 RepID=A0A7W7WVQ0_9PSEU|nr:phosphate/phosphite/phosphonate ABC transporter substrate-binding protein [Saccharothrix violaceirubra]MBB4965132.1 phosphonate transport system substrate-binding protein [Saccharothrix violaceirubra]
MRRVVLLFVLLAACQAHTPPPPTVEDPLVFSGIPTGSSMTVLQAFQPIIDMLRRETGREIRIQDTTSYDALIEGVRDGDIDIAAFGPLSYVLAKERGAPITAVAAQTKEKGKTPGFRAHGFTRAGSEVHTMADLRGRKVCFVDQGSTSGYLYPAAELQGLGISPTTDVEPVFVGSHEASVLAVANGDCAAGFAFDEMVDRHLVERGQIKAGQIVTIWRSDLIPGAPIGISDRLPDTLRDTMSRAIREKANADYLRANGFCQGECPLGDADAYGYTPVDDHFYDKVREVCKRTTCTP